MARNSGHNDFTEGSRHAAEHSHPPKNALTFAFWINLFFSVIELVGGLMTNSTAIVADSFHDFMDAGAIGLAIFLEKVSGRKRTRRFSYGFKRFSLLSALVFSVFLLVGCAGMVISAYRSFITPKAVNSVGMLWLAVLGLAVNSFAFFSIKKGEAHAHHGHHHGGTNFNHRSIMLHLLEDVLGWAAVLIGAVVIYFTGWNWIDGVLAIGIAGFVGYNATKNLVNTIRVMLQSVPENVNIRQLTEDLSRLRGVAGVHDVHVWSLDGTYNVGSLHVVVTGADQDLMPQILGLMKQHNIQHPTVQIETGGSRCGLTEC